MGYESSSSHHASGSNGYTLSGNFPAGRASKPAFSGGKQTACHPGVRVPLPILAASLSSRIRRSSLPAGFAMLCLLQPSPGRAQDTGTVRGTVVDSVTGRAIPRVLIESPTGGAAQLTDNAGHFQFDHVPLGQVQLRYRRPGYFDSLTRQTDASMQVTLAADSGAAPVEQRLLLDPAAALHGQLALADGDSAHGMRVDLYQAQITNGRSHWHMLYTTPARNDGSFAFDDLHAGSYIVHAEASLDPVPPNSPPSTRAGYAPAFAPGTADINAATVYTLAAGQAGESLLRLARVPFYPVQVRTAGDGPRGFVITGSGFTNWNARYSREDDAVVTELPSGNYTLRAFGGNRQASGGVELPFHVDGAPVSGLSIGAPGVAAALPVTTTVDASSDSGTAAGAAPRLIMLTFLPVSSAELDVVNSSVQTDESTGESQLRQTPGPGQYWVSGLASGGYIATLTSGGTDLLREPLSVAPGTTPAIAATLRQDGGTLSVTREGDAQRSLIQVIPLSADGTYQASSGSRTGDTSTPVLFSGLAPATTWYSRWLHQRQSLFASLASCSSCAAPESRSRLAARRRRPSQHCSSLHPACWGRSRMATDCKSGWSKSALVLALALAPAVALAQQGYPIAGRVVDAVTGAPLGRVSVSLEPVTNQYGQQQQPVGSGRRGQQPGAAANAMTASDGSFQFTGLPAGAYQLQATRRGYISSSFEAHDGYYAAAVTGPNKPEASHLRFPLEPLAAISGTVFDSSGDPVQSATLSLFAQSEDGTGTIRLRQSGALERGTPTFSFATCPLEPTTWAFRRARGLPRPARSTARQIRSTSPIRLLSSTARIPPRVRSRST